MKKTILLAALFGLVSTASAVSFQWTVSGIAFNGTTLKSDANLTASLVYLGVGGSLASSYDEAAISSLEKVSTVTGSTSKGAASETYYLPAPSSGDYTDLNGGVYALLLSYADSASGKTFYNIGSATYTVSGVADATSSLDAYKPAASTFSYGSNDAAASKVTPGGGWATVPEPSTAALALAGLALLLKRRKA